MTKKIFAAISLCVGTATLVYYYVPRWFGEVMYYIALLVLTLRLWERAADIVEEQVVKFWKQLSKLPIVSEMPAIIIPISCTLAQGGALFIVVGTVFIVGRFIAGIIGFGGIFRP